MEGVSIIIPVFNKLEITRKCINHIRGLNKKCAFDIVVVDNGSTDKTPEVLSNDKNIIYLRNQRNLGISKAYNHAGNIARYDILCFMHNDVFVFEKNWISKIRDFILKTTNVGVVGLYGAKTIRKDGSFRGKTIIHSKKGSPTISKYSEKIAVVDGLLLAMSKTIFHTVGGFSEDFPMHFYDKDISLRAIKSGFVNYVLSIPFEHQCATTRKTIEEDESIRNESQERFVEKWSDFLSLDVSTWRDKIKFLIKKPAK